MVLPRFPRIGSVGPDWGPRGDVVQGHDRFLGVHFGGQRCGLLKAVWLYNVVFMDVVTVV